MSELIARAASLQAEFLAFWQAHWPQIQDFFNSVFFAAVAGSMAGAFAGARAAQVIAEKNKNRDELTREIRSTNAANMVAYGIFNSLLSLKKRQVLPMKTEYESQKERVLQAIADQNSGAGGTISFSGDFRSLPVLRFPIATLHNLIFEGLLVHARPVVLLTMLTQAVDALNETTARRNIIISSLKNNRIPAPQLLAVYFGLPYEGGKVDQEFSDSLSHIYDQIDDGLFFCSQLCLELTTHGNSLTASFRRHFGNDSPRLVEGEFSTAREAGLMPDERKYAEWFRGFVRQTNHVG